MLHVPMRTPSQLAAIEHRRKFTKEIEQTAARRTIPIVHIDEIHTIPVKPNPEDVFGPVVCEVVKAPDFRDGIPRIEHIIRTVCKFYGVSKTELLSARRTSNLTGPRHVLMYLCKTLTLRSLPYIGRKIGGRDHTTVLHGVRKIEELRKIDEALAGDLQKISEMIFGDSLRPVSNPDEAQHDATAQPAA